MACVEQSGAPPQPCGGQSRSPHSTSASGRAPPRPGLTPRSQRRGHCRAALSAPFSFLPHMLFSCSPFRSTISSYRKWDGRGAAFQLQKSPPHLPSRIFLLGGSDCLHPYVPQYTCHLTSVHSLLELQFTHMQNRANNRVVLSPGWCDSVG